tara:strand:- start:1732 stop:2334 length:603 start_codon:yes stop_codon:yes gene_type:complete
MFLFLDAASPIPEFHLIEDKKIIKSIKIIEDSDKKLSNSIIPKYLEINSIYNLNSNIKKLIVTIGPGSYTALRVGASFISGLSQSLSLPVTVVSTETIYDCFNNNKEIGIYFESSNNQKFFSYKKGLVFFHEKIENENYILPKNISSIFYNVKNPKFNDEKIYLKAFSIKEIILKNIELLEFKKNLIIKPIYISNNSILN